VKGVYALVIKARNQVIVSTGALGDVVFAPGTWVYTGSALGTGSTRLDHRIKRHFTSVKTLHWHIDFLLEKTGPPVDVIWARTERAMECKVAEALKRHADFEIGPRGFGASDCNARCGSHVFRFLGVGEIANVLSRIFLELEMRPDSGLP
jgi:Uri superfamily endonuclease